MTTFNTERNIKTKNLVLEPINILHAKKLFSLLQSKELFEFIPQDPPQSNSVLEKKFSRWSKRGPDDGKEIWLNYAIYHIALKCYTGTVQYSTSYNST